MTPDSIKVYSYKPKIWLGPAVMLFFGWCANFYFHRAESNRRGLVINRLIELTPPEATNFYWALYYGSLLFVLAGSAVLILSITSNRCVALTNTGLIAPKGRLLSSNIEIPYHEIRDVGIQKSRRELVVVVTYKAGKLSLLKSLFHSEAAFQDLCSTLRARTRG